MQMISFAEMQELGSRLSERSGPCPPAVYDLRIDSGQLEPDGDPNLLHHVKHQALLRSYQARYVLLPDKAPDESIVKRLQRHYDPVEMSALEQFRPSLEAELIEPLVAAARMEADKSDPATYAERLVHELQAQEETAFVAYLRQFSEREHHYRNFLIQSSADLLAEASASALGIVGEFGAPQSALFRILIDEFGYGVHDRKHSVLYRATLRDFGLCDEYNGYWPLFDTATLQLHNTIHYLFQNPRNFFMQIGFLLFAETAYQRSTRDHFRYLREFHPDVDARYFGEHAHIDLHHSRMVIDEVVKPFIADYGQDAGREIVVGAELTRQIFNKASEHLLSVSRMFAAAVEHGDAFYRRPLMDTLGQCITPSLARLLTPDARIQVGGLGEIRGGTAFADFPPGATGCLVTAEATMS